MTSSTAGSLVRSGARVARLRALEGSTMTRVPSRRTTRTVAPAGTAAPSTRLGPPLLAVDPHHARAVRAGGDRLEHGAAPADEAPRADAVGRLALAVEPPGERAQRGERDDGDADEGHPLPAEADVEEGEDRTRRRRRRRRERGRTCPAWPSRRRRTPRPCPARSSARSPANPPSAPFHRRAEVRAVTNAVVTSPRVRSSTARQRVGGATQPAGERVG